MLKSELVARNPLRVLDQTRDGGLVPGGLGLVAARAGTGKTAFLIQVALDNLFRDTPVLHVSVGDTVSHVKAWYEELFRDLAEGYDLERAREVWAEAERNRMIMTFRVQSFTVQKLEERLTDLVEQDIFAPRTVVVDGLDAESDNLGGVLDELAEFARTRGLKVWAAVRTHRDKGDLRQAVDPLLPKVQLALGLQPGEGGVELHVLQAPGAAEGAPPLVLDPRTFLLKASS
ncbi:AAA family ATPase [Deferrisoma camini]|uniref:AAA family ATPase n=1 Tax=Deferrisoma camini TaxID=1035120 RepID=UPI00046C9803|nr:AAA family ATPase [Deferrisoma camini]